MPENFGAAAIPWFPPPWLWAWFNLHERKALLKRIWPFYCLIILLNSVFDSSEKPALVKAIDKPAEISFQNKMHSMCVCSLRFV